MVKLVVTTSNGVQEEYPLSKEMVIGRNKENDIRIKEEKASRTHCRVKPDAGRVLLEDLDSSNGTRVNGTKIKSYVLKDGDTITIGKTKIVFHDEDQQLDRTIALPAVEESGVLPDAPPPPSTKPKPVKKDPPASASSRRRPSTDDQPGASKRKPKVEAAAEDPDDDDDEDDDRDDVLDAEDHEDAAEAAPAGAAGAESSEEKAARIRREAADQRQFSSMINLLVRIAAVVLFFVTVWTVVSYDKELHVAVNTNSGTSLDSRPLPPPLPGSTDTGVKPPPLNSDPGLPTPPLPPLPPASNTNTSTRTQTAPPTQNPDDPALAGLLTKVLAERDKMLTSGNLPGARAVIQSFASAHPSGAVGVKARQEWKDTLALIDAQLMPLLDGAKKAAADKQYSIATQRCTKLIAADPSGKFGEQAREILSTIDVETEPKFSEFQAQARSELHAGKLRDAAETLGKALDELAGTKWGATIAASQLEAIMADTLLEKMEAERQKRASGGKEPVFNMASKKLEGTLSKVHGVTLDLKMNSGVLQVPLKSIDPTDFALLLDSLNLGGRHLEQAYLWLALDRKDAARKELDAALLDPAQSNSAAAIAGAVFDVKTLHAWDFSKWQHQSDWDALSGSWSTMNGKYVLESPEGGDTALRPEAVGGQLSGKNLRISFDFELNAPHDGYLFVVEFGTDEQHAVSAIFNAGGMTLHSNIGDASSVEEKSWKPVPTHVELAVQGDTLNVSINGKAAQPLQVAGLASLKGTLTFRARETACSIAHVIVRTAD